MPCASYFSVWGCVFTHVDINLTIVETIYSNCMKFSGYQSSESILEISYVAEDGYLLGL
jgi:hypothetical protein